MEVIFEKKNSSALTFLGENTQIIFWGLFIPNMEAFNASTQTNLRWKPIKAWRIICSQQFAKDPQLKFWYKDLLNVFLFCTSPQNIYKCISKKKKKKTTANNAQNYYLYPLTTCKLLHSSRQNSAVSPPALEPSTDSLVLRFHIIPPWTSSARGCKRLHPQNAANIKKASKTGWLLLFSYSS